MRALLFHVFLFIGLLSFGQRSLELGSLAPDIEGRTPDGKKLILSNELGSITIVHFWASWSKACTPMNNYLTQVYTRYKKEGVKIFSVSIDKKEKSWQSAIKSNKLTWETHICDFKGLIHSKPAKDYFIFEVPTIFVLDENGKVLAINPTQDELNKRLKALETDLKILPNRASKFVYFTKKSDYTIKDEGDTLILAGKGKVALVSSLEDGNYTIEADGVLLKFQKTSPENDVDFQINYKVKVISLYQACNYVLRSKNGNLIKRGFGTGVDFSNLDLKSKEDYFLVLPNSTYMVKLY
ncbi:TlpA family protein disulfide reductase [Cyclobacteriaceae bacterium]|nr:TlpA family protein disulfide reductase [Cyclobacteriaceae bacterium]